MSLDQLQVAVETGDLSTVQNLLTYPKLKNVEDLLYSAAQYPEILELLVQYPGVKIDERILLKQIPDNLEAFRILLSGTLKPRIKIDKVVERAFETSNLDFIYPLVSQTLVPDEWLVKLIKTNNFPLLKTLWYQLDPGAVADDLLIVAIESMDPEIVKFVLADPELEFEDVEQIYDTAISFMNYEIFNLLLDESRLYLNMENLLSLINNEFNSDEIEMIINHPRVIVTPESIITAITYQNPTILKLLLDKSQISPDFEDNRPLKYVMELMKGQDVNLDEIRNYGKIIKVLLRYPPVLRYAITQSEFDRYTTPLIKVLLKDAFPPTPQEVFLTYWEEPLDSQPGTMKHAAFRKVLENTHF